MSFAISPADLASFSADYQADQTNAVLERAVTKNGSKRPVWLACQGGQWPTFFNWFEDGEGS